jgi:hypothetical protein
MSSAGLGQLERAVDHASEAAAVYHVHPGSEGATTVGIASQQRHRRPCKMERLNGIWGHEVIPVIISRPPGFRLFKPSWPTAAPAPRLPTFHPWAQVRHFPRDVEGRNPW